MKTLLGFPLVSAPGRAPPRVKSLGPPNEGNLPGLLALIGDIGVFKEIFRTISPVIDATEGLADPFLLVPLPEAPELMGLGVVEAVGLMSLLGVELLLSMTELLHKFFNKT